MKLVHSVKRLHFLMLLLSSIGPMFLPAAVAQDMTIDKIQRLKLTGNDIVEIESDSAKGFNFPYYLFIPETIDRSEKARLFVETNNTGTATDDFEVHREKALRLVNRSYPNRIARRLQVPLLVPVFPRPRTGWRTYTHALDRDSLEKKLRANGFDMHDRIFMHGFSASAKFCNRFTFLHPERIKAAAAGGVNGLPTLPIAERNGSVLPFPIGIADIEAFTGKPFKEKVHRHIPQFIYMGYMDRNDTLPSRDAWREDEANVIRTAIAAKMMPDRWKICQTIYREKLPCVQCVTYDGVGHAIKDEMIDDLVKFFEANSGDAYVAIEPHAYPFIEYRQIHEAHVNAVYFKGDKNIPEFAGGSVSEDTFLIGIKEWLEGQDHRQLDEFVDNAGFHFRLHAEGHQDIVITQSNYRGNSSMGDGRFQAYYVKLDENQLQTFVPNVPYTLHPENRSEKYVWKINDGVTVVKPIFYGDLVLEKLNSTFPPHNIALDADVEDAVKFLNLLIGDIEYAGQTHQIHFKLQFKPGEIAQAPKIRFSAKGLSVMEVLLIICHRASLDYRIEGTTVYLESTK
jgi:hypothetical protein